MVNVKSQIKRGIKKKKCIVIGQYFDVRAEPLGYHHIDWRFIHDLTCISPNQSVIIFNFSVLKVAQKQ